MNLENHEVFAEELNQISDEKLRNFDAEFLDTTVPKYFYHVPASSSGKFHPVQDLGEGGTIRHTKAVVKVGLDLLRSEVFVDDTQDNKDIVITACLLHDTFKNGKEDSGHTVSEHPKLAGRLFNNKYESNDFGVDISAITRGNIITSCILCHMGKWNTDKETGKEILPKPNYRVSKISSFSRLHS